jgi:c(7)-type cytochrome triheme protein
MRQTCKRRRHFINKGGDRLKSRGVTEIDQVKGEKKMRLFAITTVLLVSVALAGTALAVPPGKTLVFENAAMGNVTFSGQVHADKGFKCSDCHTKVFPMKKTDLTMAAMREGKECGHCHDGTKAFSVKGNCTNCHKK